MKKVTIKADKCKSCALCVSVCPMKILRLCDKINIMGVHPAELFDEDKCTSCAMCAMICPDVAIKVERE